uniref:Uncharacterized protein n=2 Tax=Nicotiana TaxID=4085 RepID=A0A1S3XQU7_TOBAC|nr:PREDICTED: uncharacterized protein LOC107767672 [Nicotiana tabacum]
MKRFKDCVALVQHSITIANANTRRAHRAYGQVICQVFGWDINRLPSIVLTAGDNKSSESSDKLAEAQGNENDGGKNGLSGQSNTTDTVNVGSNELSQQKESLNTENKQENGEGPTALKHNSLNEVNVSNGIPEIAKEIADGASNCLVRLLVWYFFIESFFHENILLGCLPYLCCTSTTTTTTTNPLKSHK